MKILFIGDVVGDIGIKAVTESLPILKEKYLPDFIIINGENSAKSGRGISKDAYNDFKKLGVDVITLGNHTWDHDDIYELLDDTTNIIIRPANYPDILPGRFLITKKVGIKNIAVVNLCGQIFMAPFNCPFEIIDKVLDSIPKDYYIIVDFHAEATSEKIAMGYYLAKKVTAVIGTHTHVQTNDSQILDNHTAYITDVGMTGSNNSIIGMTVDSVVKRFRTKLPVKLIAESNITDRQLSAVLITTETNSTKAKSINPIRDFYKTTI